MENPNPKGYGAPFFKIWCGGVELIDKEKSDTVFSDFVYRYNDDEDDYLNIKIDSKNRYLADKPEFQAMVEWQVQWGYLKTHESEAIVSPTRTVYVYDIETNYTTQGVCLKLRACDKAGIALRKQQNGEIHQDKTVGEIAAEICAPYGIYPKAVYVDEQGKINIETFVIPTQEKTFAPFYRTEWAKMPENALVLKFVNDPSEKNFMELYNNPSTRDIAKKYQGTLHRRIDRENLIAPIPESFIVHEEQVGNKTLWNFLKQVLKDEPNGPFTMTGRDSNLLIKKRTLNQAPQKIFYWEGGTGELLTFKPETKNRTKRAKSRKIRVMGWDPELKQQVETWVDATTSKNAQAGAIVENPYIVDAEELNYLKNIQKLDQLPQSYLEELEKMYNINVETMVISFLAKPAANGKYEVYYELTGSPRTNQTNPASGKINQRILNKLMSGSSVDSLLQSKLGNSNIKGGTRESTAVVQTPFAIIPARVIMNILRKPEDELARANADRLDAAMELNPAEATTIGDPRVESEKTIKILNAAHKHSGMYYVKEVLHKINNSGFKNEYTLLRDGIGKTGDELPTTVDASVDEKLGNEVVNRKAEFNTIAPINMKTIDGDLEFKKYGNEDAQFKDRTWEVEFKSKPPKTGNDRTLFTKN
jgi:hypothetical protein